MPTYYLNPVVIVLSDLEFEKVDLEPGSGQFVNADFLIQDFGSMSNLSISVDRTVVDGRIIYYTDANNVVLHSDGAKFFSSETLPLPSYVALNDLMGTFHPDFTNEDGNGDRVVDSSEDLLRGAIFTLVVKEIFTGLDTSQVNFTQDFARDSTLFFDNDTTQNIIADILAKTESEFNREVLGGGAETDYWNGFSSYETGNVPFEDGDKIYVAYSIALTFVSGQLDNTLSALVVDQSGINTVNAF